LAWLKVPIAGAKFIFGTKARRVDAGKETYCIYDNNCMPSFKMLLVVVLPVLVRA
jgi:hypothetical protein